MWGPDDKDLPKKAIAEFPSKVEVRIMSESDLFEYCILNQETTRQYYGLTMKNKKLVIIDKEKLENAPFHKKEMLREIWRKTNSQ